MDSNSQDNALLQSRAANPTADHHPLLTTLIVQLEDGSAVLERVVGLVRRRACELRSLSLGRAEIPGRLHMTLLVEGTQNRASALAANLRTLPNVVSVDNVTAARCSLREFAVVKVAATSEERAEIMQIAAVFRARIIDVSPGATTIESTGGAAKIDKLVDILARYGIIEMARTGPVAMTRGDPRLAEAEELPATDDSKLTRLVRKGC